MTIRKTTLTILLSLAILFAPLVASSFYCGNRVIHEGVPQLFVLFACGEPQLRNFQFDYVTGEAIEIWSYNLGPDRFMRLLYFRNARLYKIEESEYGF